MGMSSFVMDQQERTVAAAVASASTWIETARPLIVAYIGLSEASAQTWPFDAQEAREAREILAGAGLRLQEEITSVRDQAMMDAQGGAPCTNDDAIMDAWDEICETVERETPTVDEGVKRITRELAEAEMARAA